MSGTLLRFGLWIVLIVLALYVLRETYEESPAQEYLATPILQKAGVFGLLLIAGGATLGVMERVGGKLMKNRCVVCRKPVAKGEIYCRQHLRRIFEDDHDRTHGTFTRRK